MKHYEYLSLSYGRQDAVKAVLANHREAIDRYASAGWRYAGMIPTEISASGCFRKVDLIFEREEGPCPAD